MNKDSLGDRMKQYENIPKNQLMRRQPVIIRIDGKAFHTFTRGFQRPFDNILIKSMQETMKYLCENIQNVKFSYCQSDEISLLLTDYENINTAAWFDYQVQKMCSIAASMATLAFNRIFSKMFYKWGNENLPDWDVGGTNKPVDEKLIKLCNIYESASEKGAMFDARCFSRPDYQNKGLNSMLFVDLFDNYKKLGFKYAETNANLETNIKVQAMWDPFEKELHKRRWVFGKEL